MSSQGLRLCISAKTMHEESGDHATLPRFDLSARCLRSSREGNDAGVRIRMYWCLIILVGSTRRNPKAAGHDVLSGGHELLL
jgi:hypothetical protein